MTLPAVFLDRDGVINQDKGYVYEIDDFEWIKGAIEAIKLIKKKGYYIFVVTNQSGISRNFYTESDVTKLHNYICNELSKNDTYIDDFFYSPYHPEVINKKYVHLEHLRKPNTGMLELAEKKWSFIKYRSLLIGDKESDIECAKNYGIKGYLFNSDNLYDFVKKIQL